MRLWHYALLPYLPDAQFKGQLRELVAIMHDWRDKGQTNHLLINKVMNYPKSDLFNYLALYSKEYSNRGVNPIGCKIYREFIDFTEKGQIPKNETPFDGWHNKTYLRVCMANLYEKHLGVGKSRITDEEWAKLCRGYEKITGERYEI